LLTDRSILIVCLLLVGEGSPMWITEMRDVFQYRLTAPARDELGLGQLHDTGIPENDSRDWYHRVSRGLHRIIDLMDGWPARRRGLTLQEREQTFAARDPEVSRVKQARLVWFTNSLLEMTIQAQPRRLRRNMKGAMTVDQTNLRAPSPKGRWRKDVSGREIPRFNKKTGEEIIRKVMEIDADYVPIKNHAVVSAQSINPTVSGKSPRKDTAKPAARANDKYAGPPLEWAYSANLIMNANHQPGVDGGHPQLFFAASLSTPNKAIGERTIELVDNILSRGHTISRFTADRGYGGNLTDEDYFLPLQKRGVPVVTDYKKHQKGITSGFGDPGAAGEIKKTRPRKSSSASSGLDRVKGFLSVEGAHYCPATPKEFLDATLDRDAKRIDSETYAVRIQERKNLQLKPKERPDANGNVPMMCPAHGPSATVECPIRTAHPKVNKKTKTLVLKSNLPDSPPSVCTQTSVVVTAKERALEQLVDYGTPEWAELYRHDRNSMESGNDYVKSGPEQLGEPRVRRLRGMAAQQFTLTFLLVNANLRRIFRYIRDERRVTPKKVYARGRDIRQESQYVRGWIKPETTDIPPGLWTAEDRLNAGLSAEPDDDVVDIENHPLLQ
jgi:hypothetical protein